MQDQRTCTKCGTAQPLEGFYRRGNGRVLPECKDCTRARVRVTNAAQRERRKAEREAEAARLRAISHKVCTKCKKEQPHAEFYLREHRRDGLSCWCKSCTRAATRETARRHGPRTPTPEWTAKLVAAKALAVEARSRPCIDCGLSLPPQVMHLHHRDPAEKEYQVSVLVRRHPAKLDVIRAEIAKCDVLCPNCHSMRHYREAHHA